MSINLAAWRTVVVLAACVGLVDFAAGEPAERYMSYSGTAVARHSAQFLYGEQHVLHFHEDKLVERVVLYTCADGSPFARKTVAYVDSLAPDFLLEVASNGMQQGIRTEGPGRAVFFRSDRLATEKVGPLPHVRGLVADVGFDEFIRTHWQALMSGKSQDVHFVVPGRLEELAFQAQHLRTDSLKGVSAEVFRLKLAGVWGWVLPGIDVAYDADDHSLIRFEGISDLRDSSGDNLQTEITFPPEQRSPSSAWESAAARQAQLAPCM